MLKRTVLVFLGLLCLAGAVSGQEKTALTNQLAFFWDVRIGTPGENVKYAEIIARSTLISFEQKDFKPVPSGDLSAVAGAFDRARPLTETVLPKLISLAKEQGSSFVVLISYYSAESSFYLEMRGWDLAAKSFFEFKDQARTGLELYNRLNDATGQLVSRAGKVERVGPEAGKTEGDRQRKGYVQQVVLLSGDEGCEIYINGVMRVGVVTDGKLVLPFMPLNVGSKLVVEKRKNGFYSDTEEVALDDEWVEYSLRPLEKQSMSEGVFVYTLGQFVGFGIGYYLHVIPRQLYLGVENYFYLQTSDVLGNHAVIHDDIRLLAGFYLISVPGVPIKVGLSTGAGCILTYLQVPPNPLFTDFYFNLLNIIVEFRLWDIVFFVREEFKLGLGLGNNLLGAQFFLIRGNIPIFSFGAKLGL